MKVVQVFIAKAEAKFCSHAEKGAAVRFFDATRQTFSIQIQSVLVACLLQQEWCLCWSNGGTRIFFNLMFDERVKGSKCLKCQVYFLFVCLS